jgi:hypothetical protein
MQHMHDGARAQFNRAVRDVLNNIHQDRWIGRGGPTAWPSSSPDFNPPDFYLWGASKNAYACSSCWHRRGTSPSPCGCLSDYLQLPRHISTDVAVHNETCRGVHWISWRTFWAPYKRTVSAITQKLNVSGHMLIRMWNSCPKFVCAFQLHPVQELNENFD